MLKIFRKKWVTKFVLWSLLILILPAFVMWGSASMSRSKDKGPDYAGIIDNKKISFNKLYDATTGARTQIILGYFNQPKVLDALLNNKPLLAKLAWDRLIMLGEAKKIKIKIKDREVIDFIRTHPLFVRSGAFDEKFYSYILRNNIGLEPRAFEESIRENITIQKLAAYISRDVKVSDEEVYNEYLKEFGKLKIAYLVIEPKNLLEQTRVDENAVKEFYEKNKNELIVKSNLKGALPDRIAAFEEVKEMIEKHLREVEAKKIFKETTEDTYKRIAGRMEEKKETFEKAGHALGLDVKYTDFFSRDDKIEDIGEVNAVANEAYSLKEFQLSKPVELSKGYIIFEVTERKAPDEAAFKKEKEEYSKKVRDRRAGLVMEDWLKGLEKKAQLVINLEEIDKYYR